MQGYLRRIIPFSSVDGPGNRTVVFLQGCNFHCLYCHNPETQPLGDSSCTLTGVTRRDHLEIVAEVLKYRDFIQGVTISGGECTVQRAFLLALCKEFKQGKVEVFIDTNGHLALAEFAELCPYVDKFMFDIKSMDESEHQALTGQSPNLLLQNLRYAIAQQKLYEIRTVVVKNLLQSEYTVSAASRIISVDPNIRYKLIKFRPRGVQGSYTSMQTPSAPYMAELRALALALGVRDCVIV